MATKTPANSPQRTTYRNISSMCESRWIFSKDGSYSNKVTCDDAVRVVEGKWKILGVNAEAPIQVELANEEGETVWTLSPQGNLTRKYYILTKF